MEISFKVQNLFIGMIHFKLTWARIAHGELLWSVNVRRVSSIVRRQQLL